MTGKRKNEGYTKPSRSTGRGGEHSGAEGVEIPNPAAALSNDMQEIARRLTQIERNQEMLNQQHQNIINDLEVLKANNHQIITSLKDVQGSLAVIRQGLKTHSGPPLGGTSSGFSLLNL